MSEGEQSPAASRDQWASRQVALALAAVGAVASQAALLTALLYYVGWSRAHASLEKFGLDPELVGYGTEEYVLRSINAAFPPLVVGTTVSMGSWLFTVR